MLLPDWAKTMTAISEKNPLKDIHVVILDLDGTMIDSVPDLDVALNSMLHELTLPPVEVASIRMFVGRGTQNLVRSTLSVHLESDEVEKTMDIAMTLFYKYYRIVNGEHSTVFPGVREGLQTMKEKRLNIACVTNKPSIFTEPLLAKNGLYSYFNLIYCSDTFLVKNPILSRCRWPAKNLAMLRHRLLPSETPSMMRRQHGPQDVRYLWFHMVIITENLWVK